MFATYFTNISNNSSNECNSNSKMIYEFRAKEFLLDKLPYLKRNNFLCRINQPYLNWSDLVSENEWLIDQKLTIKLDKLLHRRFNFYCENLRLSQLKKWLNDRYYIIDKVNGRDVELNNFMIEPYIPPQETEYWLRFTICEFNLVTITFAVNSIANQVVVPKYTHEDISTNLFTSLTNGRVKNILREFVRDIFELFVVNFTFFEINRVIVKNEKLYVFNLNANVDPSRADLYEKWNDIEFPHVINNNNNSGEVYLTRLNTNYWLKLSVLSGSVLNWRIFYLTNHQIAEFTDRNTMLGMNMRTCRNLKDRAACVQANMLCSPDLAKIGYFYKLLRELSLNLKPVKLISEPVNLIQQHQRFSLNTPVQPIMENLVVNKEESSWDTTIKGAIIDEPLPAFDVDYRQLVIEQPVIEQHNFITKNDENNNEIIENEHNKQSEVAVEEEHQQVIVEEKLIESENNKENELDNNDDEKRDEGNIPVVFCQRKKVLFKVDSVKRKNFARTITMNYQNINILEVKEKEKAVVDESLKEEIAVETAVVALVAEPPLPESHASVVEEPQVSLYDDVETPPKKRRRISKPYKFIKKRKSSKNTKFLRRSARLQNKAIVTQVNPLPPPLIPPKVEPKSEPVAPAPTQSSCSMFSNIDQFFETKYKEIDYEVATSQPSYTSMFKNIKIEPQEEEF